LVPKRGSYRLPECLQPLRGQRHRSRLGEHGQPGRMVHLEGAALWDAKLKGATSGPDTVWPTDFDWKNAVVDEVPF